MTALLWNCSSFAGTIQIPGVDFVSAPALAVRAISAMNDKWIIFISEFIGTALLLLVGLSIVILDFGEGSPVIRLIPDEGIRRLIMGFLFGTTGALIAVSPVGKHSGGALPGEIATTLRRCFFPFYTPLWYTWRLRFRVRARSAGDFSLARTVLRFAKLTVLHHAHMQHQVKRKQQNSKMCLVCGLKNPYGLKGAFYELENNELVCFFTPTEVHQSYPGRLHGGITTAILDETIGRAIMMRFEEIMWGVTVEFTTKFKRPIPLDQELRVVGRITSEDSRFFEGTGELLLPDGQIAATGHGKYIKQPLEKIADFDAAEQEWKVTPADHDPKTIEL